jgi:cell division GTPase FtsZ
MENKVAKVKIEEQKKKSVEPDGEFEEQLEQKVVDKGKIKELMNRKEKKVDVVSKPDRALNWFIVGCGQGGSRIAETFYDNGYEAVAINTAEQDLKYINVPEENKLLVKYALDGAGKEIEIGEEAFSTYYEDIDAFVGKQIPDDTNMVVLAITGGGGTGSGSAQSMINMMNSYGHPLIVLYVMPLESDDVKAKNNSLITLSRLAKLAKNDVINSLVVVDNAKIETLPYLKQGNFWSEANGIIVEPFHIFNMLSVAPSSYTSLDPMDFGRVLTTGDCCIYGHVVIDDYMEELSLAEAIVDSLESGLLASGFDLKTTRSAGVIILGDKDVLSEIPAVNINYAFDTLNELTQNATIFRGIYEADTEGKIKIYTIFSGLGLPRDRIEKLKEDTKKRMDAQRKKDDERAVTMEMDYNVDDVKNDVKRIHEKIKQKRSAFGKLTNNVRRGGIIDRRRR